MTISDFDHLNLEEKEALLRQCCGSAQWIKKMMASPAVEDLVDLMETAEENWYSCTEQDWREAFAHHPKIGDINSLKEKYAGTAHLAANEQAGVHTAPDEILEELKKGNDEYEKKYKYIFIVCATGKRAEEMLSMLKTRMANTAEEEIKIAAEEQNKITQLRLEKLFV